jgi:DUF1365 family protein
MRSHVLEGTVRHRRVRPFVYDLEHAVYYLALDLAELDDVDRNHRLLSRNRHNLLTFRDADHLDPPAADIAIRIQEHLAAEAIDATGWRITLVTNPRVFGYVFNPASFYLCRDADGELAVVVVEVHNTHLERHLYTLRPDRSDGPTAVATMDKAFYVSPFIEIVGGYTVRIRDEPESLRIAIDHGDAAGGLLYTSLVLRRRPMTDRVLARMLVRHPFITQRTIGMIHWHALRLWRRGARFHRHRETAG